MGGFHARRSTDGAGLAYSEFVGLCQMRHVTGAVHALLVYLTRLAHPQHLLELAFGVHPVDAEDFFAGLFHLMDR